MKKTTMTMGNRIIAIIASMAVVSLGSICLMAKLPSTTNGINQRENHLTMSNSVETDVVKVTTTTTAPSMFVTTPSIIEESSTTNSEVALAEEMETANIPEPETIIPEFSNVETQVDEAVTDNNITYVDTVEPVETYNNEPEIEPEKENSYAPVQSYTGGYTWADVCSGNFYYCGSDGFEVSAYEMYLLVAITEHEFGFTTSQWCGVDESTFDWMQCLMASTVINRARYGFGDFGGYSVLSVLQAPGQYMSTDELSYFQLGDPERTFRNCMAVLDGSAGVPTNIYWEGSLEGSGCSGVYNDTWYYTPWGSCVAFGYR